MFNDLTQSVQPPPTTEKSATDRSAGPPGFELLDEIGRGGMGVVYRARDATLGREVAVKLLHERFAPDSSAAQRFLGEARVTGQLQHPGVPAVHHVGRLGDGRPFLAMKLIKGRTLDEILKARLDPSAERGRLLAVFEAVCQAVGYAHAHHVIHRDLKPANIMVGAFGEVQVMDWGLAKLLGMMPPPAAEPTVLEETRVWSEISPTSEGDAMYTQAGTLIGTPSYIPPEQAAGELEKVDERADVFGLGALLAVILTGKPPYVAETAEAVRVMALRGELKECLARLGGCGAEPELVALCKKCLAFDPADRPRHAGEVAKVVAAHQAAAQERARQAELDRVRATEQRKRARVQLALAGVILLLLLVGGGGAVWLVGERERQRSAAEESLERLDASLREGRWEEARIDLDRAEARLGGAGPADLRQRLARARADLDLVTRLDGIRLGRAKTAGGSFLGRDSDRLYASTFAEAGLGEVGDDEEAVAMRVAGSAVREALVAALDDWTSIAPNEISRAWLLGVARRADPHAWRDRLRDPALWGDEQKLAQFARQIPVPALTPNLAATVGARLNLLPEGEAILRSAQEAWPNDFWLNFHLGFCLARRAKPREAESFIQAAHALRPGPVAHDFLAYVVMLQGDAEKAERVYRRIVALYPNYGPAHCGLGVVLSNVGKVEEGEAMLRKAVALDPKFSPSHAGLGLALGWQGKYPDAEAFCRQAIALDPNEWSAHYSLGVVHLRQGKLSEAERSLRKAVPLDPHYSVCRLDLGIVLYRQSKLDEAEAVLRDAIDTSPRSAEAHKQLGWALYLQGKLAEAQSSIRKAIELDPKNRAAHNDLGVVLRDQRNLDGAEAAFREAIKIDPTYAIPHRNLGTVLERKGDPDGAIIAFREAIKIDPKFAMAHNNLGSALSRKGQMDEAIACFEKAIELDPRYASPHNNLGSALSRKGQVDEAIACYQKAIALDPKFAMAHYNLGNSRSRKGQVDEAIACYQKAVELDPKYAEAHCNLGHALAMQGRFAESLAAHKRGHELGSKQPGWPYPSAEWVREAEAKAALEAKLPAFLQGEFQPADSKERLGLAGVCQGKKRHHAAAGLYAAVFAAEAKLADDLGAGHRYNAACSAALAAAGQGEDAAQLADAERTQLRQRALDWLRADLALHARQLETGKPSDRSAAQRSLRHWKKDPDLAGVRDTAALAKLPAHEQKAFAQLWADVAALLKKTEAPAQTDAK